ncbi:putative RNA-binding protein [Methanohalophilus levihalophilus]|uniref:CooT family nickel-binding protein n=1 Tax=Methanohalophilus levihalophilus TaxID=1431282 RepID=UPI001AE1BEE8|nr:CooT family nickel-binding protein [Methanohalophilus levihalophilus]MBP2029802.1 putative RNA-binding protein [Methanohalophilus levihalophilus]
MCELKAIFKTGDDESRTVMESVTKVIVNDSLIEMTGIFGEKEVIEGKISEIDFSKGELIIVAND